MYTQDNNAAMAMPSQGQTAGVPQHYNGDFYYVQEPSLQSDEETGFQFWNSLSIVLNRKWMILAIMVFGLALAAVLALTTTPLYRATATIEIQKEELQIIEGAGVEQSTTADAEYMETQFQLLRSRSLAERVAENLGLVSDPRYADQSYSRPDRLAQTAGALVYGLDVSPAGRSRVINVEFVSPYQYETSRIANAVVENFIEANLERRYNTTAYAREFLAERLATTKSLLEQKERELVDYAVEADIMDLTDQNGRTASLDANSIVTLNSKLAQAESARIAAEQVYLEATNNQNVREIVDNDTLRELRTKLAQLEADYESNRSIYQPQYPEMQRLQTRINALRSQIQRERDSVISALLGDYNAALAQERSLRRRVGELTNDLEVDRDRRIQYNILKREVDTNRSQYDALLQRMKEVSIASGIGSSQVQIVDAALVPEHPFAPNVPLTLLQAFILSLSVGVGLAFALNYIDDTIKSAEDIRNKLNMPPIGLIPRNKERNLSIAAVLDNPKSPITEAYLSTSAAINFTTTNGAPKSLLITSTRPAEGKSSSTLALGKTYARNGKRVLIIDADMRKPSFAGDQSLSIGLSGLLTRDDSILDQICGTETENLYLLPAGIIPPSPADLLSTYRLRDIIHEAQEEFDLVLVDSPPVLSFADAPLLGAVCEAALVVIESGATRSPAIQRIIRRMHESRTNIIGAILVKFDARKTQYDYGYYYSAYGEPDMPALESSTPASDMRKISILRSDADASDLNG